MYSKLDDVLALLGLGCLLSGIYLWLGLPATLILLGIALMYIGARIDTAALKRDHNEPDQTTHS